MGQEPLKSVTRNLGWAAVITSNVLTVLFLFCILMTVGGIVGLILAPHFYLLFIAMIVVPGLWFLYYYSYFAKRDPNRLQSERHNWYRMHYNYLTGKGGIITDPAALVPIEKPAVLPTLELQGAAEEIAAMETPSTHEL